jgi:ATP-dependent Clp protease ATP-binding subunit ClpC
VQRKGVTLEWDDALIDHLAEAGYLPESGAHELSRLVRDEVESRLARQMLGRRDR